MKPIQDVLNKIKWDKREKPEEYVVYYQDNVLKKFVAVRYNDILRVEEGFFVVLVAGRETEIPLHRIREVRRGEVVWRRPVKQ
ncbi:DUF504 domain-containing protein [Candidatus Woesearchaeota archaeon]|nr:DUF504 domain-containing protein [Candidatus Woesearchaeota archaeon]